MYWYNFVDCKLCQKSVSPILSNTITVNISNALHSGLLLLTWNYNKNRHLNLAIHLQTSKLLYTIIPRI